MENNLTLHLKRFNSLLSVMNQTNQKQLVLSASEARGVQSDIYALLAHCANLSRRVQNNQTDDVVNVSMDGGGFK
jgi:hypothetical protein